MMVVLKDLTGRSAASKVVRPTFVFLSSLMNVCCGFLPTGCVRMGEEAWGAWQIKGEVN
jgi:hypothetical protein